MDMKRSIRSIVKSMETNILSSHCKPSIKTLNTQKVRISNFVHIFKWMKNLSHTTTNYLAMKTILNLWEALHLCVTFLVKDTSTWEICCFSIRQNTCLCLSKKNKDCHIACAAQWVNKRDKVLHEIFTCSITEISSMAVALNCLELERAIRSRSCSACSNSKSLQTY
jgi:hypothetical protein